MPIKRRNSDDRFRKLERDFYASPTKSNLEALLNEMHRIKDYSRLTAALKRYVGLSCELKVAVWKELEENIARYTRYPWTYEGKTFIDPLVTALAEARRLPPDQQTLFMRGSRSKRGTPKRKTIACLKKLFNILEVEIPELDPYAWPGGYEIIYLLSGGPELSTQEYVTACSSCATGEVDKGCAYIAQLSEENYEYCEYCNKRLGGDYIDEGTTCSECGEEHNSQDCPTFSEPDSG